MSKVQPVKHSSFSTLHKDDGPMKAATSADIDDFEFDEACLFDYDYYDETNSNETSSNEKTSSFSETKNKNIQNSIQESLFIEEGFF